MGRTSGCESEGGAGEGVEGIGSVGLDIWVVRWLGRLGAGRIDGGGDSQRRMWEGTEDAEGCMVKMKVGCGG